MPVVRKDYTYVSPTDDCQSALLDAVDHATKSITILCYAFTDGALTDLLKAKHAAGVKVEMVVDRTQAAGATQKPIMAELAAAGIPVIIARSPAGGINHQKVIVVDAELGADHPDCFCISGSYNFSGAQAQHQENTMRTVNDPQLCDLYLTEYDRVKTFALAHIKQPYVGVS